MITTNNNRKLWISVTVIVIVSLITGSLPGEKEVGAQTFYAPAIIRSDDLPRIAEYSACSAEEEGFCVHETAGSTQITYRISNPYGISGFQPYKLVNFEQRLIGTSSDYIDVEITSTYHVNTTASYPVNLQALPPEIRDKYLQPESGIQSDAEEIVNLAQELVSGIKSQAEAVEAILTWVRAHIEYDYNAPGNDALSVYLNRRAVCAGFSRLSVALFRAAGIPARYHRGCATPQGYITDEGGGWHAWVEVYHPDVGWVASEPQNFANAIKPFVIFWGFNQCGWPSTKITELDRLDESSVVYAHQTPYISNGDWRYISAANIPSWERDPLKMKPSTPALMLPISAPVGELTVQVENWSCGGGDWEIFTEASWLGPESASGSTPGKVTFSINANGMDSGAYETSISLISSGSRFYEFRKIQFYLWLVDEVHTMFLPVVNQR